MKVHKFTEILTYFNTAFNEIENFLPTTGLLHTAMSAFVKVRAAVRHTSTFLFPKSTAPTYIPSG